MEAKVKSWCYKPVKGFGLPNSFIRTNKFKEGELIIWGYITFKINFKVLKITGNVTATKYIK